MMIGLVNQNDRLAGRFHEQLAHLVLWSDARRGVVGIANVDQSCARLGEHLRHVVTEAGVERHLDDLCHVDACVIEDSFEGWIGNDHFAAPRHESGHRATTRSPTVLGEHPGRRSRGQIARGDRHFVAGQQIGAVEHERPRRVGVRDRGSDRLQTRVPVLEHLLHFFGVLGLVALRRALRLRRMGDAHERDFRLGA